MGKIITSGEEKRPRITCHYCKHENVIDIRGWNNNIAEIGVIVCKQCNKKSYVGLLILANVSVQALGQNVAEIIKASGAKNVLRQGEEEPPSIIH